MKFWKKCALFFIALSVILIVRLYLFKSHIRNTITKKAIKLPYHLGLPTVKPPHPPSRLMYRNNCSKKSCQ